MQLHWHHPKHSMHGDTVQLVAPCGRYLIEFGMSWSGGYYVACCDHIQEEDCPQWEAVFPTAEEAKEYAQRRVDEERWWINDNQIFFEPCPHGECGQDVCLEAAAEERRERKIEAIFSD